MYLRTGLGAVHDCVTSVDREWISKFIKSFFGALIS